MIPKVVRCGGVLCWVGSIPLLDRVPLGGFRDALPDVAREAPDGAFRGTMSERIALLARRIEKRKRTKTGIPGRGKLTWRLRAQTAADLPINGLLLLLLTHRRVLPAAHGLQPV